MEQKKISQLTAGETFEGFVIIKSAMVKTGQTGKNYMDLTISDSESSINAKIWDYDEERFSQYRANSFVKVRGTVTSWQGTLQLRIERIRLAQESDPVKIEDFVPSAPLPGEIMLAQIRSYADRIKNKDLKGIALYILNKYNDKLLYWPAAVANHHSVRGGLLYHTLTMLKAGEALLGVYTSLDPDWVYAGVIVHDMEKINEINSNELGIASDYSRDGQLLGHLVQCTITIHEAGNAINADPETTALLEHLVLAHHYEPEFGSPRRPMFPEAELVHYLDVLDARMYDFAKALTDVQEGDFSERQWVLHNRRVYKRHTSEQKETEEN
ncbi:MAG TPA: HD domain-containing protein [Firmicutes bacterium]|nr:HD domain-containing protein [Bacillota bacterium]